MALTQTLSDLDAVPVLLESIRLRSHESRWFLQAEQWASKATQALEKLAVHYEDEEASEDVYKEPKEFGLLKSLDRHIEILMGSEDLQKLFMEKLNDYEMVELLLPFIDPSANDNQAIQQASRRGYVAVVERLLAARDASGRLCVDTSANENEAIRMASENGHVAVVERLLADPRVDPSINRNRAIRMASENGHLAVVERLLADPRVDPSNENNWSIQAASENGHLSVVERLLLDERVDPSAENNYAILCASENGHVAVVERLLAARDDSGRLRIDPSTLGDFALPEGSPNRYAILELLNAHRNAPLYS